MTISVTKNHQFSTGEVIINGRFVFDVNQEFRLVFGQLYGYVKNITINLCNVTYMDSSAIGMLINLLKKECFDKISLKIIPNSFVDDVLKTVMIDKLFDIHYV